jgi:SulP family sulfate permease
VSRPRLPPGLLLGWVAGYRRGWFRADVVAGVTVAVLLVPQAMAYATLAGLPPVTGLYAAIAALVGYALLGSSAVLSVAPTAIDSLLVAGALAAAAAGADPADLAAAAALLALLTGAVQLLLALLRAGALVNFLSRPVISGFTSAAALTIALSQVKDLLGLRLSSRSTTFLGIAGDVLPRLGQLHGRTALLGGVALAILVALRRVGPRLPAPLLVVVGATVAVAVADLDRAGVAVVGRVPGGLPTPTLPDLPADDVLAGLLPYAAVIAVVSYLESISAAKSLATAARRRLRPNRELLALGAANTAAGLFRGFPVAGGFSRGALNVAVGARTQLAGVVAAAVLAVTVVALTPLFRLLPRAALAAVVVVAVAGLVDVPAAVTAFRVRRSDGTALVVTFAATLLLGVALGLAAGAAVGVGTFVYRTSRPSAPEVGRVEGTVLYRSVRRYRTGIDPAAAVLRLDAPLYFANAEFLQDRVRELVAARPELRFLVLDLGAVGQIDATGSQALTELDRDLSRAGVELHLATVRGPVRDVLARAGLWERLVARGRVHAVLRLAMAALPLDPGSPLRPEAARSDRPPAGPVF